MSAPRARPRGRIEERELMPDLSSINWSNVALGAVILAIMAYWFMSSRGDVSGEQARKLVAEGARLVDVRTPAEYRAGHIDGAVNIPVSELGSRTQELGTKDGPIVVYCQSGARSGRAKQILAGAGFTEVHNLGGIGRW